MESARLWPPLLWVLLVAGAAAQERGAPPAEAWQEEAEAWLADSRDADGREQAAASMLDAGERALGWLARELRAADAAARPAGGVAGGPESHARLRALESLATAVALQFVDRVQKSEMFYAGQYDPMRALMPYSGRLYLTLLLDTPDWFAEPRRLHVIPALRDLYPESPGRAAVAEIRAIAEHETLETWALRRALFCALAQWGDRELADHYLAGLEESVAAGDAEDRLEPLRELAQAHHLLRDPATAARHYRELLRGAERIDAVLPPTDYYNAACVLSASGDLESALDELERCVDLMQPGRVDPSAMLDRDLFVRDPEIANVRETERFRALLERIPKKVDPKKRE